MKAWLVDLYNRFIVKGWWRKHTVWIATLAALVPALLPVLGENVDLLAQVIPYISDDTKALIRLVALCAIPIAAAWKQASLQPPAPEPERKDPA